VVNVAVCDLCRSTQFEEIYSGLNRAGKVPLRIVRCRSCGLMTQNPRRTSNAAADHYRGVELQSQEKLDAAMEERRGAYEMQLLQLGRLTQGRRLLDVGCGSGDFLRVARDCGWDVWGVEPSEAQSEFARDRYGLRVHTGILDPAAFQDRAFDAVTLNFVLEHIPDPRAVIAAGLGVLAPGGVLFIMVPNCGALEVRLRLRLGKFQGSREADSGHAFYFTRATLAGFVEAAGGRVVRTRDGISGGVVVRRMPRALHAAPRSVMAALEAVDLVTSAARLGTSLRIWATRR
jgi:SAM-dependent methyltransferase